ncbi:uncharacterized protein TNCV_3573361 [Trichonephila clavipes]|nr:uncharacterized protein TNCV_3573361 [Trichonephila clavipes]
MSDSKDDKSPQRRGKLTKTPSEDSNSSNKPMEVDPSDTPAADSSSKPEEKGASASQARDRLSIQPPDSYGGARPKVFPKKKEDGTKKSSDIPINSHLQRASEVLEATVCRRRELFRRRREDAKKVEEPVSRYLGPDWINAAAEERPPSVSPATRRLRALARNMQATEYEKRRREGKQDFKPWISTESGPSKTPAKQTLSNEPVECQFEDSFKAESDPDDPPRLQVKLPDLGKKSPEPSQKPKDKDEPVEEASPRVVHHDRYHAESISRFMFLDRAPFFRPEFDNDREPLHAYFYLDAIFAQHGIEDWRRFALAAYQAGRYHTEPELQTARAQMEELHVTEEEFLQLYHIVRRDYEQDEGCCDEFSDLVDRILTLLESIELMTSAMLYMGNSRYFLY